VPDRLVLLPGLAWLSWNEGSGQEHETPSGETARQLTALGFQVTA
jgi:hypothetical protein